jgi:hypothetical protein
MFRNGHFLNMFAFFPATTPWHRCHAAAASTGQLNCAAACCSIAVQNDARLMASDAFPVESTLA